MHTITEKTLYPDTKGRITLGEFADGVSGFHAFIDNNQRIVLEPFTKITYKNPVSDLSNYNRSPQEAAAHILSGRKGNVLPEGVTINDLINEGRA